MLRFLGIACVAGTAFVSIAWSLANFPDAESNLSTVRVHDLAYADEPGTGTGDAGDTDDAGDDAGEPKGLTPTGPLEALAQAGLEDRQEVVRPVGPGLLPGVYRVGDLDPEPVTTSGGRRKRVLRDRDFQAREAPYQQADGRIAATNVIAGLERWSVGGEIEPGLYATSFEARNCGYELTRVLADRSVAVIGEEQLNAGRLLVNLNEIEPDWFASTAGCGPWYRWHPLPVPLTQAGNGDYWIGDLSRGTWQVPGSCRWEIVAGFRGALMDDVVRWGQGPEPLVVGPDTYGVRVRNCNRPMTLRIG